MLEIAGYFRLSSEDTALFGTAFNSHKKLLLEYGIIPDNIYYDLESGGNSDRENFLKVLTECKHKKYHTLVIANLERLTRSVLDWELILRDALTYNFDVIFLDDKGLDIKTSEGQMMSRFKAIFAQYELEKGRARQRQRWEYLRKHNIINRVPFGYTIKQNKIVIDEEPTICLLETKEHISCYQIALEIIDLYTNKIKTLSGVAKFINNKYGYYKFKTIPTKKTKNLAIKPCNNTRRFPIKFTKSGLHSWLQHPILRGHLVYFWKQEKETFIYNNHQAIINPQTALSIHNIIAQNNRSKGFTNKRKYPLSSLVYCSECHNLCSVTRNQYKSGDFFIGYRCRKALSNFCHNRKTVNYKTIENALINALASKYKELTEYAYSEPEYKKPPQLIALETELTELTKIYAQFQNENIKKAIDELKVNIFTLTNSDKNMLPTTRDILQAKFLAEQAFQEPEYYYQLSNELKFDLYHSFVNRCIIYPDGNVTIQFYF